MPIKKTLTRLDGDCMVVSIKDTSKMLGVSIMTFCAVVVCNLFLNFYIDLKAIKDTVTDPFAVSMYEAQVMTSKVVCSLAGGCLALATIVLLFFYIKHYIDSHSKEIGILKALGYSDLKISKSFSLFSLSVFIGCLLGFGFSFILMKTFYEHQNAGHYWEDIKIGYHPELFLLLVIVPTILYALFACVYSLSKLNRPCINLLKGIVKVKEKERDSKDKKDFVSEMRSSVLKSKKTLVFFIAFSAYCFSSMIQMSAHMDELASDFMGMMILSIGIVLAFTTFYISVSSVLFSNNKNIAMMRVFGYSASDCKRAVLDGYRVAAYIGFAVGSLYQYYLLKIMVEIVFKDIADVPEYNFDFKVFFITLAVFILLYEGTMLLYQKKIKNISLKEIMLE